MAKAFSILLLLIFSVPVIAQETDTVSLQELEIRIARLQEVNDIPAIGLALIDNNGKRYTKAFGQASMEQDIPVTENSMFRLGSISKMFAALAILKLRDEGQLNLSDPISEIIPEIAFENQWKENYPIRVQHLLDHTTGWDDLSGIEWLSSDPKPLTTKEGLDLYPPTRVSRWAPGTRMAYSNIGAPVAAYIVEKLSGKPYEQYISEQFFDPMGLQTSTFLYDDEFQRAGVTHYRYGEPLPYYHINGRAAGALNSSPVEILKMLDLFLNRGIVDSSRILPEQTILDMENLLPDFGLVTGYALCNYTSVYEGFIFRGHNGAIDNAHASFYYLPEHSIGYALMTSSMHNRDFRKLNELVTNYLIQGLEVKEERLESVPRLHNPEIEGFYYFASPRNEKFRVIKNLFEPAVVKWDNDTLIFGPAFGKRTERFVPISPNTYASGNMTRALHLKEDHDGSLILYKSSFGGAGSFKPISGFIVYARMIVFAFALMLSFATSAIVFIQLVRLLLRNTKISKSTWLGLGPSICSLVLFPLIVLFIFLLNNPVDYLYSRNSLTMLLFVLTLSYGLFAGWSVLYFGLSWQKLKGNAMNIFMLLVSVFHFLLAVYLFGQDMIGIQTWT